MVFHGILFEINLIYAKPWISSRKMLSPVQTHNDHDKLYHLKFIVL